MIHFPPVRAVTSRQTTPGRGIFEVAMMTLILLDLIIFVPVWALCEVFLFDR